MATAPFIAQGTINRLSASLVVPAFPLLAAQSYNLMKAGISLTFDGPGVTMIDTMTGMVTSPEPYLACTIRVNLLRTQQLGLAWRKQFESNGAIGDVTVIPDSSIWTKYIIYNCGLGPQGDISMAGDDPGYQISIVGTYYINSILSQL